MDARKKVTIREVADAAGVSPATVSLVFNDKGKVAPATRARVLEIGESLGYRPNWLSKAFRSGRANVIGVVVGHDNTPIWELTYLPYYRGIIAGAAMEALGHAYTITAVPVSPTGELSGPIKPDGIIVVDPGVDDPLIERALGDGMIVVAAGGHTSSAQSSHLKSVAFDLGIGIPAALDELIGAGATRPAFFRGPVIDQYTVESQQAYESWCAARGVEPLIVVLGSDQAPIDLARELISGVYPGIDAVYCINESYSSAMAAAASELEVAVPGEFSVAVAGEPHSGSVDPNLLYLDINPIELGAQCAKLLIHTLEGEETADVRLPLNLGSLGSLRNTGR